MTSNPEDKIEDLQPDQDAQVQVRGGGGEIGSNPGRSGGSGPSSGPPGQSGGGGGGGSGGGAGRS
jgi:hypothetical protein